LRVRPERPGVGSHPSSRRQPRQVWRPHQATASQQGIPSRLLAVVIIAGLAMVVLAFMGVRMFSRPASVVTPASTTGQTGRVTPSIAPATPAAAQATPAATAAIAPSDVSVPDIPMVQRLMMILVNQDRQTKGLAPVAWDQEAATAGMDHASEMVQFGYLSHWDLEGRGPDWRYTLAGGLNNVRENVYLYQHSSGAGPDSRETWEALIREAEQSLMESPRHRDNILAPEHTHVGIGVAYDSSLGRLAIAQEFTDHYVALQPVPLRVSLGESVMIRGRLEAGATSPLINVAYELPPKTLTLAELNSTGTYESPAQTYQIVPLSVDAQGHFAQSVKLDYEGQAGLYHVRVWVETRFGKVPASDVVVAVQ
jgi:uncharacterized protein YkwD